MADPKFNDFIPSEMQAIAERSVQQAQKAFEDVMSATQRAVSAFEGHASQAQTRAREIQRKVVTFSERNITSSLQFAQKFWAAKTAEDLLNLHVHYVKEQVEALTEQARELAEYATQAAKPAKDPKSGGQQAA